MGNSVPKVSIGLTCYYWLTWLLEAATPAANLSTLKLSKFHNSKVGDAEGG